jgi:hypothetical protein
MATKPIIPAFFKVVDPYSKEARAQKHAAAVNKFQTQRKDDSIHSNRFDSKDNIKNAAVGYAANVVGSFTGIPQVSNIATNLLSLGSSNVPLYSTSPINQLYNIPGLAYNDFRSRKSKIGLGTSADIRLDGATTALNLTQTKRNGGVVSWKAYAYVGASAAPGGVYNLFNRNGAGTFGYGWGDHGNPAALRRDFTSRSHVSSRWSFTANEWKTTVNPLQLATPFRGDKVNVIDYRSNANLKHVYQWRTADSIFGIRGSENLAKSLGETRDFIKFYFTGPKLAPHTINDDKITDDVIVFRATIGQITDSFQPTWTPVTMVGRADPNYHYTAFSRDLSMDFVIYATDRDELKPIYRKLNALAGYTTPDYISGNTIGLTGPWMRITVGDLFNQVPVVISSLSYTFGDNESPWEINIEEDPENMQVPFKIQVSISFSVVSDWLPQKGGQFYSLSKRFDKYGSLIGSDNWLSDSVQTLWNDLARGGTDLSAARKALFEQFKNTNTIKGVTNIKDPAGTVTGNTRSTALSQTQQSIVDGLSKL